jgi:ATP-dependent Lhr-like helicase
VRFFFRGEGHLFLPPEPEEAELSPPAQEALAFLRSEGACFFADLQAGTGLADLALSEALVELVLAGLVTNDTLQALRQVLAWRSEPDEAARKPLTSLQAELAAWREARRAETAPAGERSTSPGPRGMRSGSPAPGGLRRPSRGQLQAARRAVGRRLEAEPPPRWPGRWSLVHRIGVWGREVPYGERLARQAQQLLQCFGIVTRESLDAALGTETLGDSAFDWGALYSQLQLMEMRGEVRRGYFVEGLPGAQFALPEAVERLRAWTQPNLEGEGELVLLNAGDPGNLFGPEIRDSGVRDPGTRDLGSEDAAIVETLAQQPPVLDPGRFARISANYVVLLRGRPVLLWETGGDRLVTLPDLPADTVLRALRLAVGHVGVALGRLTVSAWNGAPVLENALAPLLERAGFRREALVYVWEG